MRSIKKLLWLLPLIAMLIALVPFAVVADGESEGGEVSEKTNGWTVDADGVQRYYVDGAYLTGVHKIDKYSIEFAENGAYVCIKETHDDIGVLDTNEGAEYKAALQALKDSGKKIYSYHDFNDYVVGNTPNGNVSGNGGGIANKSNFQTVQRYSTFQTVLRGENGKAIQVIGPSQLADKEKNPNDSNHCYASGYPSGHVAGEEIVSEIDEATSDAHNHEH